MDIEKMKLWTDDLPKCAECGTCRHPRLWRGLCIRCYPLVAKIEKIDRGLYRRQGRYANRQKDGNRFIRRSAVRELANLKALEAPLNGQVTGRDIEGLLLTICEVCAANAKSIDGVRYIFDGCLHTKNIGRVYEAILRIIETLPSRRARQQNSYRPF